MMKSEIGETRGTYGGRGEVHIGFWWGNLIEGGHLENLGVGGKINFKGSSRKRIWS